MGKDYNQQPNLREGFALTPRIETFKKDIWYNDLFDRTVRLNSSDIDGEIQITAETQLRNNSNEKITETASDFELRYQ